MSDWQERRRLLLSTYRHVPQPEPPPTSLLPAMFGLTDADFHIVDDDGGGVGVVVGDVVIGELPTSVGCYAASSSSSSEISQSNSIDLDPTWSAAIRKNKVISWITNNLAKLDSFLKHSILLKVTTIMY